MFSISSALLCLLVTGFILTFAIVVMSGITKLEDKDFLKAFQVTDGIIQGNQPLFLFIWLGSVISVLATMVSALIIPEFRDAWLIVCVGGFSLVGVQGLTIGVHLPLNDRIRDLKIDSLDNETLREERLNFEKNGTSITRFEQWSHLSSASSFFQLHPSQASGPRRKHYKQATIKFC
jgi:uncharacterized membrane protein